MSIDINTCTQKKVRLFIASDWMSLTQDVLNCLPVDELLPAPLKRIPPEQWHLTWAFLGQTDPALRPVLQQMLAQLSQQHATIQTKIESIDWWPKPNRAMGIALCLEPTPALIQLADDLQETLLPLATQTQFKGTQLFIPHITIARLKPNNKHQHKINCSQIPLPNLKPIPWTIDHLSLYQSTLTGPNPQYQCLLCQPLPVQL